jgi:hypothetical protein
MSAAHSVRFPIVPRLIASALVGAMAIVGCTTTRTVDTADLIDLIESDLAGELGIAISDTECPQVTDPDVGDTVTCAGTIDGQTARFTVTFTDVDDLSATVINADAILIREQLIEVIAEQVTVDGQPPTSIECFDTQYLVAAPGSLVSCAVTGVDQQEYRVQVEVLDRTGAVDLTIVD